MPEYVHIGLGEAVQIIRLIVDHYRSGRITIINDDLTRATFERAYKFLTARHKAEERYSNKKTDEQKSRGYSSLAPKL